MLREGSSTGHRRPRRGRYAHPRGAAAHRGREARDESGARRGGAHRALDPAARDAARGGHERALAVSSRSKPSRRRIRLNVVRSLTGGPAFYEPKGEGRHRPAGLDHARGRALPPSARGAEINFKQGRIWLNDPRRATASSSASGSPSSSRSATSSWSATRCPHRAQPQAKTTVGPRPDVLHSSAQVAPDFRCRPDLRGRAKGYMRHRTTARQDRLRHRRLLFTADPLVGAPASWKSRLARSSPDLGSRTGVFVHQGRAGGSSPGEWIIVGCTCITLEALAS